MADPNARERIGFVGLGVMGSPMAGHLSQAGYRVLAFDLDPSLAARLCAQHGSIEAAASPAQAAAGADVVITMLPNGNVVQQVALGPAGLHEGLRPGTLLLDTSSSEPWLTQATARALAERGIGMVDAPVSGAQWGAQAAELVFMVGGAVEDFRRVKPMLELMGRATFHLGPLGAGHAMKCLNNLITAMTFLATAEGLIIGKRHGLDPAVMNQVLNESTGMSWITKNHIDQRIISRTFDDPFKLELMTKDIAIAMELARSHSLPVPLAALVQQFYRSANQQAGPGAGVSELVRWAERFSGVAITPGSDSPSQGPD